MGETRNAYIFLVRKPLGKWTCGRLRKRWEDDIKIYLKKNRL
jgi:hypothetical protein